MDRFASGYGMHWLSGQRRGFTRRAAALVWLAFIVFPLVDAIERRVPALQHILVITGAAAFVGLYVLLIAIAFDDRPFRSWRTAAAVALIVDAAALAGGDSASWAFLFIYCAACLVLLAPAQRTFEAVLGCAALSVLFSLIHGSAGTAIGAGGSTLGIGLLMVLMRDLRVRNHELTEARAELARVAVAEERERFARDLHDLLGHSLSVIALKAELAGKLIADRPAQAAVEVREVEAVARQALGEVRDAVSGYRQPTLEGELAGARMALAAAGIEAEVEPASVRIEPEVEAVLAWAVREGATNVIRHSGARRCTLRVSASLAEAAVEVIDDGPAATVDGPPLAVRAESAGHGLPGLRERAALVSGEVVAGPANGHGPYAGGFRLRVAVPRAGATA